MSDDEPLSRRDLLRGRIFGRAIDAVTNAIGAARLTDADASSPQLNTPTLGRRYALPIHRPPGAVDEVAFLSGCTRCNACITACPVGAIVHAPERFREAAGTPMIDLESSPCVMCADTPCITACEPEVLRASQPMRMGVAWIQTMACLAHNGSFCSVCSERCPVPDAIAVEAGKPRIRENVCTGCGVCSSVCPAPQNAIVVMPLADRPRPSRRVHDQDA
ncbi:MAG: 4Fe-4S binding protein [Phycisphaerae bacterium]|nr:4Fe-4S binding protein [Phycisphaerae bacterium]